MKKVTIEYDLSDSKHSLKLAMAAPDMYSVLKDMDQELRSILKHRDNSGVPEEILNKLWDFRAQIGSVTSSFGLDEE